MSAIAPTNTTLEEMAALLRGFDSFVIVGHVNPDGDCLGSQLALGWALRSLGKSVDWLLARDEPVEPGLGFLPGLDEMIPADSYEGSPQVFITCDVSLADRLLGSDAVRQRCEVSFTIDHHAVATTLTDYSYIDPDSASTTMLVWDLIKAMDVAIDPVMALCAYTGLMTDTGGFRFQNADAQAFRHGAEMVACGADPSFAATQFFMNRHLASYLLETRMLARLQLAYNGRFAFSSLCWDDFEETGATKADAEPLIDVLRSLSGVSVACLLKEQADHTVRGSLRSKDDTDVRALAITLGGGGHHAAAGFTIDAPLSDAVLRVWDAVGALFPSSDSDPHKD